MKILITGGSGLVGTAFKNIKTSHELVFSNSKECNLLENKQTIKYFKSVNPDAIIHLAAKVGGVKSNSDFIADYFYENTMININVLNAAKELRIPKVVSLLSTCIYPDNVIYPLTEEQIHNGEPHSSNFGYAYAKRSLEVFSRAIRKQHGLKYITAVPNNIFGENDNFDLHNSHVVPAVIRKIFEANQNKNIPNFWGSGLPLREFTYSKEIAKALLLLTEEYDDASPINIGNPGEISIKDLVCMVCKELNYTGKIEWDSSKPEGQYRKPSCNKKFMKTFPSFMYTSMNESLKETCNWFVKSYPNIRGI